MSTLQKLKAYFGMIPAEELDEYDSEDPGPDYRDDRRDAGRDLDEGFRRDTSDALSERESIAAYAERHRGEQVRGYGSRGRSGGLTWGGQAPVHGALAAQPEPQPEPVGRLRPVEQPVAPQPARADNPLATITTLHLRSYNEARSIGEPYRDGIPVIMDLTEMEDAGAKRLVDFAAGLAFAMRGDMDRITTKVFLLSPPNVNVTAEDKRRMAQGGFFARR